MNIFFLDTCPKMAARYLGNKHVVKMTLESAQMLCTIQRGYGNTHPKLYKSAYTNHPCTKWAGSYRLNYMWLLEHFKALMEEYTFRFKRKHRCSELLPLVENVPYGMPDGFTLPPQCVHEDCKVPNDPVAAYRLDYNRHKSHLHHWGNRHVPWWANKSKAFEFTTTTDGGTEA